MRQAGGRARAHGLSGAGWAGTAPNDWQIGCQLPSSSFSNTLMLCPPHPRPRTGSVEGQKARENDGRHGPHGQPVANARVCACSTCAVSCRAHLVARACGDALAVVVVRDMVDAGLVARRHLAGRVQRRRGHHRACAKWRFPPLVRSAGAYPDVPPLVRSAGATQWLGSFFIKKNN